MAHKGAQGVIPAPDWAKTWSETAKNIVQTVAIFVAGWWTYEMYVRKDADQLIPRARTSSTVRWDRYQGDACLGTVSFEIENNGSTAFDIASVRIRAWEFRLPRPAGISASVVPVEVDLDTVRKSDPVYDREFTEGPFVKHYPPESLRAATFHWVFRKASDRQVLFVAQFFRPGEKDGPEWYQSEWATLCDPLKP